MRPTNLIEALDRFLEAASAADKWRALNKPFGESAKQIGRAFAAQGKALLAAELVQGSWLETWDMVAGGDASDLLLGAVQAAAGAGMEAGAAAMAKQFELDTAFNLRNPRAITYLKQHGAAWITGINDTTRSRIQTIVAEGAERGLSYTEIANILEDTFAEFAPTGDKLVNLLLGDKGRSRAELIAITELGQGYERGNEIVVEDLVAGGLKMQKKWLTTGDGKVSDGCRNNQAQGWIAVEDAFQSGDMTPLRFPGCRCTCLYRRKPK